MPTTLALVDVQPHTHRVPPNPTGAASGRSRPTPLTDGRGGAPFFCPDHVFAPLTRSERRYGGIDEVVREMNRLAREAAQHPAIRTAAARIAGGAEDLPDVLTRLFMATRARVAYVRDELGTEEIQSPLATLHLGRGDCEDHTLVALALAGALGIPARYRLVTLDPARPWHHVYAELHDGDGWVPYDTTIDGALGLLPFRPARSRVVEPFGSTDAAAFAREQADSVGLAGPSDKSAAIINADDVAVWFSDVRSNPGGSLWLRFDVSTTQRAFFGPCHDVTLTLSDGTLLLAREVAVTSVWNGCEGMARFDVPKSLSGRTLTLRAYKGDVPENELPRTVPTGVAGVIVGAEATAPPPRFGDGVLDDVGDTLDSLAGLAKWGVLGAAGLAGLYVAWPLLAAGRDAAEDAVEDTE